jgi:hypothetical protein
MIKQTISLSTSDSLWRPNPGGQAGFLDDYKHRYIALAGGFFAGKSWAGARKLVNLHILNSGFASRKLTFTRSLAVGQTFGLAKTVMVPEISKALEEANVRFRYLNDQLNPRFDILDLSDGGKRSEILVRSAEIPRSIAGFSVGAVWGDEVARWPQPTRDYMGNVSDPLSDPIMQSDARLRDPNAMFQQFLMTFTHEGDNTSVFLDFESKPKADHMLYRAGTNENPTAKDFAAQMRSQMSPDVAKQYLDGFGMPMSGGNAFPDFDVARHAAKPVPYDPALPICWSLDFNVNPMCSGVMQKHKDGVRVIHEFFLRETETAVACKTFIDTAKAKNWNLRGLTIYGDATGRARDSTSGASDWAIIQQHLSGYMSLGCIRVPDSNPLVKDTINSVRSLLLTADGKSHVAIDPSCMVLIADLRSALWPDKHNLEGNHALAWFRYFVDYEFPVLPPRPNVAAPIGFAVNQ